MAYGHSGNRYIELGLKTCLACGASFANNNRLEVHHIDGNRDNNAENNQIVLCKICHTRLHFPLAKWHRDASKRMRGQGYTLAFIGKLLGLSRQRIHQIISSPAPHTTLQ